MNYIPYATWWIRPSGTSTQIANYFCSWGLGETLVAPTVVRMPSMPIIVTMPTYTANFCSLILLFLSWLT